MKRFFCVFGFSLFGSAVITAVTESIIPFFIFAVLCFFAGIFLIFFKTLKREKRLFIFTLAFGLCLGSFLYTVCDISADRVASEYDGKTLSLEMRIEDDPYETSGGYFRYKMRPTDGNPFSYCIYIFTKYPLDAEIYDYVSGEITLTASSGQYINQNRAEKVIFTCWSDGDLTVRKNEKKPFLFVFSYLREKIRLSLSEHCGDAYGISCALISGDKSGLSSSDLKSLRGAGLLHICAVSGLHVSFLLSVVGLLTAKIKNRTAANIISVLSICFLASLTGFSPSAVRAVFMTGASFVGSSFFRKADSLNSLGLILAIFILINPFMCLSASLLLSFSATVGIILFATAMTKGVLTFFFKKTGIIPGKILHYFVSLLFVGLSANFFVAPVSTLIFGSFSASGLIANLICIPIVKVMFILAVLVPVTSFIPVLPDVLGFLLEKLNELLLFFARFFAASSLSELKVAAAVFILALLCGLCVFFILKRKPPKRGKKRTNVFPLTGACLSALWIIALSVALSSLINCKSGGLDIIFVDVGQGSCAVCIDGDSAVIIDCGDSSSDDEIASVLRKYSVKSIDCVVISHLHSDHAGGFYSLSTEYDICKVVTPYTVLDNSDFQKFYAAVSDCGAELSIIYEDSKDKIGDTDYSFLVDYLSDYSDDENEECLSVYLRYGDFAALFPADATENSELKMTELYGEELNADLLAVSHHGSKYSSRGEFLSAVTPSVSVVSVGENEYGHPNGRTVVRLKTYGSVLTTADNGNIRIHTDGNDIKIYAKVYK